jgi:transcriptional regulator with XRE-family HTH domain
MDHPLLRYLKETPGETQTSLAERADTSRMTLWRLINRDPEVEYSTGLLKRISSATEGKVTLAELVAELPSQQQGAA